MAADLTDAERLDELRDTLAEIAAGIRSAQWAMLDSSDITNTAYLVQCTLGRLGWMTDQACVLAGDDVPPVVGDANAWMRHPSEMDREASGLKSAADSSPRSARVGR